MTEARRDLAWFDRRAEPAAVAWRAGAAPSPTPSGDDAAAPSSRVALSPEPVVTKEAEALQAAEAALAASEATRLASSAEAEETRRLLAAMRSELDEAREATRRFAMTLREDAERELVKLAMAVAARVVARELATAPELLVVWAREAIAGSPLGEQLELALSSDLSTTLTGADWGELAPFVARDPGLPSETCEVRDGKRVITVDAATRLELVGEHLAAIAERDAA